MKILEKKIPLAQLPTPVQHLSRISAKFQGPEIYIKRDDLTGIGISGNKVRKLEFSAASALEQNCDVLITCGGIQSNHARATAAVAARLGLSCHLVLNGNEPEIPEGNHFLDLMFGARITYAPQAGLTDLEDLLDETAKSYSARGQKPFIVPLGASDPTGSLGYVNAVGEMADQFDQLGFVPDHIICPTGSAGTLSGLIAGKELFALSSGITAFSVAFDRDFIRSRVDEIIDGLQKTYFPTLKISSTDIQIFDNYICGGYTKTDREQLGLIQEISRVEGILLDPVYTGKAFYGLSREIEKGTFKKGETVLFLHTGGIFGLFPYRERISQEVLNQ